MIKQWSQNTISSIWSWSLTCDLDLQSQPSQGQGWPLWTDGWTDMQTDRQAQPSALFPGFRVNKKKKFHTIWKIPLTLKAGIFFLIPIRSRVKVLKVITLFSAFCSKHYVICYEMLSVWHSLNCYTRSITLSSLFYTIILKSFHISMTLLQSSPKS